MLQVLGLPIFLGRPPFRSTSSIPSESVETGQMGRLEGHLREVNPKQSKFSEESRSNGESRKRKLLRSVSFPSQQKEAASYESL
jgi:hypothetical protein